MNYNNLIAELLETLKSWREYAEDDYDREYVFWLEDLLVEHGILNDYRSACSAQELDDKIEQYRNMGKQK